MQASIPAQALSSSSTRTALARQPRQGSSGESVKGGSFASRATLRGARLQLGGRRSMRSTAAPANACASASASAAPSAEALQAAAAAADALRAKKDTDELQGAIDKTTEVGKQYGLNSFSKEWNEGLWQGLALQGRLKEVFKQTLSLSAISFGQFTEPEGPLETGPVTVIKGTAGGFSTDANFYGVRSEFKVTTADGRVLSGVNTVKGYYEASKEDPSKVTVTFDRVFLELEGKPGSEEKMLPKPASVDQWMLVMTPEFHVTRSSLGSFALLTRAPPLQSRRKK